LLTLLLWMLMLLALFKLLLVVPRGKLLWLV
jgi:hypothetical protein